jgi:hypothetical protein
MAIVKQHTCRRDPFSRVDGGHKQAVMVALIAITVAVVTVSAVAGAEETGATNVFIFANDESNLREFNVIEGPGVKSIGSVVPTTYPVPVVLDSPDVRTPIVLSATWKDEKTHEFTLSVPQFSGLHKIDMYFYRQGPITDARNFATSFCKSAQSSDPKVLFSRFFACKDLVGFLKDHDQIGTITYYAAVQGWFNASYSLSRIGLPKAPYVFNEEARSLMNEVLEGYDSGRLSRRDIERGGIDVKDIRNKMKNVQIADVFLVNEVNRLILAGKPEEARKVNNHVKLIFKDLQDAAQTKVVQGINAAVLDGNEEHINALEGRI